MNNNNYTSPTQVEDFQSVRIRLAGPETIMRWSYGEITKPETINYRTQKPERDGLFDERIFGPTKDWECYCGKYKRVRYKGVICDKCGVEVTKSSVRRERMGHIGLAVPVVHIWFLKGLPSRLGLVLDLSAQDLEKVAYFAAYIITSVDEEARLQILDKIDKEFKSKQKEIEERYAVLLGRARSETAKNKTADKDLKNAALDTEAKKLKDAKEKELLQLSSARDQARSELKSIKPLQIISELQYRDLSLKFGHVFSAGIGGEAIQSLLEKIDLEKMVLDLTTQLKSAEGQSAKRILRRLKLARSLINAGVRPEWMMIKLLPVIPPELRPMVQLDGGRFATSDLNDLYRRVINRNNRLKKLIEIKSPEVIVRNEKRMLQEAVDALIDNSIRHGKEAATPVGQKRKLRSLADLLKGKQGRFRQNLLGKRVDYSGRSVIVVGPELQLHQCGLPKKMALELFKPFVISKLIAREYAYNVRSASRLIEQGKSEIYDILEEVIQGHYVLLNRAPTLHRLSFQAFQPILIEGKAIQLHPLVCTAFNADFDGDQMAVHVPLTQAAQREAREIMASVKNLLKPASGDAVMVADKDMVVGCFYLTAMRPEFAAEKKRHFASPEDAVLAFNYKYIKLQEPVLVRMQSGSGEFTETTAGRILFNQIVPKEVGFRNEHFDKKKLQLLVREVYRMFGSEKTAQFVDAIKKLGFQWMMNSGISWGMGDLVVPEIKQKLVKEADQQVEDTFGQFQEGLLTEDERYGRTIEIWNGVSTEISKAVATTVKDFSSVYYIVKSGGRGSAAQLMQMAGIKGLVVNPSGATIELPCKSGFKDGLSVLEYFISTHGSRKGMSDTALKTADSGYLTRRLVDVAQDIVINAEDCGTEQYIDITREDSERLNWAFADRIFGRVAGQDVVTADGKVLVAKGEGISGEVAQEIGNSTIEKVSCRSVLRCRLLRGLCAKCYGYDLGFNKMVDLGSAVGIVAAQSIGEPGTQLTMRTFQSGGSASALDITQGLPRVEELLEARSNPKGEAFISEIDGTVSISQGPNRMHLVRVEGVGAEKSTYPIPQNGKVLVPDGSRVEEGTQLIAYGDSQIQTAGHAGFVRISGNDLLLIKDGDQVKEYEVPSAIGLKVAHGDLVSRGQSLTEGSLSPIKLVELVGPQAAQDYIVQEVINIYASQGQSINEKHIELIVRQMFSKVKIADPGDSQFVPGDVVDKARLRDLNEQLTRQGQKPATFEQLLMGITKISLSTDSWMAAASFQNTTQVLIEAAITGRVDYLKGLKENVIIGKLIPAGTGFRQDVAAELSAPTAVDVTALEMSLAPESEE